MAVERTYNVPLRREFLRAPKYRRAKTAVNALRKFLQRHMKSEEIFIGKRLNEKIWERGMKSPPHHVNINVIKEDDGRVYAELAGFKYEKPLTEEEMKKLEKEKKKPEEKKEEKAEEKKVAEDEKKKTEKPKEIKKSEEKLEKEFRKLEEKTEKIKEEKAKKGEEKEKKLEGLSRQMEKKKAPKEKAKTPSEQKEKEHPANA